jgi:hypothetical protein
LNYLIEQTKAPLIQTIIDAMVEKYSDTLIHLPGSGLKQMIEHEQFLNIKRMYDIFSKNKDSILKFE